jgi:hypothetical protein
MTSAGSVTDVATLSLGLARTIKRHPLHVRFGSLADILTSPHHVRFTPNNGRWAAHPSQHNANSAREDRQRLRHTKALRYRQRAFVLAEAQSLAGMLL